MKNEIEDNEKYPTTHVVHWVTGPVECCEEHAKQLVGLAKLMGQPHIPVSESIDDEAVCENCKNEDE